MRRQGKKKAAAAVAHKILVIAWQLLSTDQVYQDPGAEVIHNVTDEQLRRRAVRQLEGLGYTVNIQPGSAAA